MIAAILVALFALTPAFAQGASMFPKNPQRPNTSTNCKQALERVREAAMGSPLISPDENRKVLLDAIDVAERLCLASEQDSSS